MILMTVKLQDVCEFITDGTHQTPIYCDEGGYMFLSSKDVTTQQINWDHVKRIPCDLHEKLTTRLCPKRNDILLAKNGTTGVAALVDRDDIFDVYVSLAVLRPKKDVFPKYLLYVVNSPVAKRQFDAGLKGIGVPNLHLSVIRNTTFNLHGYKEQVDIVNKLDTLQSIITHRKQQLAKLDELVKARFVEMFGDPILNQKGFPVYRMDEVVDFQGGSQPDKKYFEYEPTDDNIRLIQIRDYKTDKYITYIPKAMAKRFCTADDIMIGRYGPPIFQILQGIEGSFNVALMKATPKTGNKEFIRYFLKQDCLLHYLEGMSQRTAGQDGIQMDKLKAYPFPFPPIELQEEFEQFAKQIDKSKVVVQKALDEAQLLFDSLMQEYFG